MGEGYAAMLGLAGEQVATVLRLLADPDVYPAVFFCAAGKDRTGVLAAIVLAVLGVDDDDIVADYALTDSVARAILDRASRELPLYEDLWKSLPPDAAYAGARHAIDARGDRAGARLDPRVRGGARSRARGRREHPPPVALQSNA